MTSLSLAIPIAQLESDDYSVPRGSYCIGRKIAPDSKLYTCKWLPPQFGASSGIHEDDLVDAGELILPSWILPEIKTEHE
jgi:hypothetical protein